MGSNNQIKTNTESLNLQKADVSEASEIDQIIEDLFNADSVELFFR